MSSASGTRRVRQPRSPAGIDGAICAAIACSSRSAAAIDTPGASLAKTSSSWFRRSSLATSACIGTAISMSPGSGRPARVMPTMA